MQLKEGDFTWGSSFVDDNFIQVGDWLDTISFPSVVTVRWSPTNYAGVVPVVRSFVVIFHSIWYCVRACVNKKRLRAVEIASQPINWQAVAVVLSVCVSCEIL